MSENEPNETPKPKKKKRRPPYRLTPEQWKLAKQIMTELEESHPAARHQIARTVRICGMEFAEQLFQDTLEVEASGGMMTADGSRRRTPGGVFFYLGRSRMTDEQRKQVFNPPRKKAQPKPAAEVDAPAAESPATNEVEVPAAESPATNETEKPTPEAEPEPPAPLPDLPPEAEERLAKLQLAADQFRRKIAAIKAEPEDQQFMLALTRKMLRNTENQIAELIQQYSE